MNAIFSPLSADPLTKELPRSYFAWKSPVLAPHIVPETQQVKTWEKSTHGEFSEIDRLDPSFVRSDPKTFERLDAKLERDKKKPKHAANPTKFAFFPDWKRCSVLKTKKQNEVAKTRAILM